MFAVRTCAAGEQVCGVRTCPECPGLGGLDDWCPFCPECPIRGKHLDKLFKNWGQEIF